MRCNLGMDCEERGVCYAETMDSPEQCGRLVHDLTQQIAARTLAFWAAEEAIRRGPVLKELATARASWAALVKDAYGSPVHPNYTKLLDERSETIQGAAP